jgi:protein tyrosine phosphatase (PTP) superfamily phosphohydrolase (DUF442 family)
MNIRLWLLVSVFAVGALGVSGCQHCHKSCPPPACVPTPLPQPPAGAVAPPTPVTPPVPVPQPAPAAGAVPPPPPNWTPPGAATPPGVRNYAPPSNTWQPAESSVRLVPPQEPPMAAQQTPPAGVEEKRAPEPPAADTRGAPSPALPVGIAQFAYAKEKEQIAAGLRPMLEGVDWLQTQGYKTVLNVRKPGEDDAPDRRMFEKRGMKYLTIEVSPQTLSKATVEAFKRTVDQAERPLFVYDRDGVLAGGLWYLYFHGQVSDEEARSRAGRLGLRADADGEGKTMWLAIQKLLSEKQ